MPIGRWLLLKLLLASVLSKNSKAVNSFMLKPRVHFMSDDAACIAYTRLTQFVERCVATTLTLTITPTQIVERYVVTTQ